VNPSQGYRPDIDGLRAVAVLAVVAFHASTRLVPGGFVGVDVFFVISGYLITGIVCGQLADGTFSFSDFYARRVRRLFPALVCVLAAGWAFGWYALTGDEYEQLVKHIAGGSAFLSNLVLWREAGYFDAPSAAKPLLHLWSLAVEEQFYLIWPPLLVVCWRSGLNIVTAAVAISLLSFAFNVGLIEQHAVTAFYHPAARLWELLVGGGLASVERFRGAQVDRWVERRIFVSPDRVNPQLIANLNATVGAALLGAAMFTLRRETLYPGGWRRCRSSVRRC
jgi:peptidoglycan/LPS O-acetylase OafA/YrhL